MMQILEFIAAFLTLASLLLLSESVGAGFALGMLANVLWIVWGWRLSNQANGLIFLNCGLIAVNFNGVINL